MISKVNEALVWFVSGFERADGQALVEYGILIAFFSVACIVALTVLGLALLGTISF